MTYGPLSSAANIGTSMLSTFAAPALEDYLSGAIDSPWLRKAIAAGIPAIAAGGIGAATSGDKYGWMNSLPAGIMGAMSLSDGKTGGVKDYAGTPQSSSIPDSTKNQLAEGDELGKLLGEKPKASVAGDAVKTATEGAKGSDDTSGIFGKLMSTPEGKMMVAMMLGNTFSGLATTAGTDAYYNNLNRQTNQANALVGQQQRAYINKALGYAIGGPLNPTVVRDPAHMYPQSMVPKADRRMGASQVRREVVTPPIQFKHGELVGPGDGMSDSIPANIDGKRKAKVATGEYVVPKEAAEKYGDKLNKMMKAVRAAAHPKKGEQVKQDAAKREFIRQMSGVKA